MVRTSDTVGRGFSLIELILIVALLAILVSIAIPRVGWETMGKVQAETSARHFSDHLKTGPLACYNARRRQQQRIQGSSIGGLYVLHHYKWWDVADSQRPCGDTRRCGMQWCEQLCLYAPGADPGQCNIDFAVFKVGRHYRCKSYTGWKDNG